MENLHVISTQWILIFLHFSSLPAPVLKSSWEISEQIVSFRNISSPLVWRRVCSTRSNIEPILFFTPSLTLQHKILNLLLQREENVCEDCKLSLLSPCSARYNYCAGRRAHTIQRSQDEVHTLIIKILA